ncbi:HAMP domain-containing protein [Streptomyces sp. NBC_00820]|uniref:cache and HAMP domain-containing protein n=1 Tax=Streptomyces sp. NBC_00820 TaxID=2975842 RepID=UPI002ED4A84B|nr:HAMP domain-containing protein [Streptomyces sp. NBC_00820]
MPLLGGVRPPIASLILLLLLVAALTVVGLGGIHAEHVPQAVRTSEQRIAADTALSVRTTIDAEAGAVRRTAAAYTATSTSTPASTLKALTAASKADRGAVLLDAHTGRLLASGGGPVTLAGVKAAEMTSGHGPIPPRLVTSAGARQLLYFARVTLPAQKVDANQDQNQVPSGTERQWLLAVSEALPAVTTYGDGRTAVVLDASGKALVTASHGTPSPDAAGGALPMATARAVSASGQGTDASGNLLGAATGARRTVAGWAQVASATGPGDTDGLGLVVLTSRAVPTTTADAADYWSFALAAAAALVVVVLLLWSALHFLVQRPLLRLYLSAGRLARGASESGPAAAAELARPVPVHGFGELARIGRLLESLRRQLLGESGPQEFPARRGPGYRALAALGVLLVACWAVPMIFMLNRADTATAVPAPVLADQQTRAELAANRVRQSLDQSYADLSDVAGNLPGRSRDAQTELLRHTLAEHKQYRSLYLLDRSGAITLRVGDTPLRTLVHVPGGGGVTTVNTSGRIPAIASYTQVRAVKGASPAAGVVLFGEIDVKSLNSILNRPDLGSVWVTDADCKVLAASVGYRAFQSLPDAGLTRLARAAQSAPGTAGTATSTVLSSSSGPSVDAAAPLAQSGPTAHLGWRVVTAEPAAALRLPAVQAQQRTMLAGILALAFSTACLGWLHVVVIRPLRAVAVLGEKLASGDRRTVLHPVNHDEVGSVTRGLELMRQALAERGRAGRSGQTADPGRSRRENTLQR